MTFYLVRHAQSLPNKSQYFSEWPLSPIGLRQAEQLAELLAPLEITRVFSSPFLRSVQTAKPFADRHGIPITLVDDLRERLITLEKSSPSILKPRKGGRQTAAQRKDAQQPQLWVTIQISLLFSSFAPVRGE
jgi:bisphosphoglycerate-dependent phosphoglycerate mutase